MRGFFAYVGAVVLVAVVAWMGAALLPVCGIGGRIAYTWQDWCPIDRRSETETRLAALSDARRQLEIDILQRERELALMQCEPKPRVQAELPEKNEPPAEIDREDWNDRRIGLLDGCWELDSRFVTTNRQTGEESRYNSWTMCFGANGAGREEMRASNGNTCSGPVTGRFDSGGALVIEEPADLQCSDGGYIYRLISRCQANDDGTATCVVTQPEVGGSTTVKFRRSARGN